MVVSRTGDVTAVPLSQVIATFHLGATWRTTTVKPTLAVSWTAVLSDGRLLADVLGRSGQRAGQFGRGHYSGLMSSVGADWSRLVPVHPRLPGGLPDSSSTLADLVATTTDRGSFVLYVTGQSDSGSLLMLRSYDGGAKWSAFRGR